MTRSAGPPPTAPARATDRKSIRVAVLLRATTAGGASGLGSGASGGEKALLAVREPLMAVTVTVRCEGTAPIDTVATRSVGPRGRRRLGEVGAAVDAADAPEMPNWGSIETTELRHVEVALTVLTANALDVSSLLSTEVDAVAQLPDGELALDDEQEPLPVPNGDVPASGPSPPHAAVMATAAIVVKIFSNLFMQRSLAFMCAVGRVQRAAVRSVTILGVRKMSSSVLLVVLVRVLNR
jgi:hypothetical protein